MTRRDFILIAEAVAKAKPLLSPSETRAEEMRSIGALEGWENTARRVAAALTNTNPRFDRDRFLQACGVES